MSARPELWSERLHLVPVDSAHLDGLHAINSNAEVMRFLGGPQTLAATAAMIEQIGTHWARFGYSGWSFTESHSGQIAGAGCIQNLRHAGSEPDLSCPLEIGWRVRRDRWRQGIASEAARALAEFAFTRLGAEVLYAVCHPDNLASMGVMKKLGMHPRGLEDWYSQTVASYEITVDTWRSAAFQRKS